MRKTGSVFKEREGIAARSENCDGEPIASILDNLICVLWID